MGLVDNADCTCPRLCGCTYPTCKKNVDNVFLSFYLEGRESEKSNQGVKNQFFSRKYFFSMNHTFRKRLAIFLLACAVNTAVNEGCLFSERIRNSS